MEDLFGGFFEEGRVGFALRGFLEMAAFCMLPFVAVVREAFRVVLAKRLLEGSGSAFCRADAVRVCDRVVTGIFCLKKKHC